MNQNEQIENILWSPWFLQKHFSVLWVILNVSTIYRVFFLYTFYNIIEHIFYIICILELFINTFYPGCQT